MDGGGDHEEGGVPHVSTLQWTAQGRTRPNGRPSQQVAWRIGHPCPACGGCHCVAALRSLGVVKRLGSGPNKLLHRKFIWAS